MIRLHKHHYLSSCPFVLLIYKPIRVNSMICFVVVSAPTKEEKPLDLYSTILVTIKFIEIGLIISA
jgi:hypothetical protein